MNPPLGLYILAAAAIGLTVMLLLGAAVHFTVCALTPVYSFKRVNAKHVISKATDIATAVALYAAAAGVFILVWELA